MTREQPQAVIHVTSKSLILKYVLYPFIPEQCVRSSLQVKISSPATTGSIKQEPEDHMDLGKFKALCLYLLYG